MADPVVAVVTELREHWQTYRRALRMHRPLAHEWMMIAGDRIRRSGEILRRYLGYDNPYNPGGAAEVRGTEVYIIEGRRPVRFVGCATEERAIEVRDNLNELCPDVLMAAGATSCQTGRGLRHWRLPGLRGRQLRISSEMLERLSLPPSTVRHYPPRSQPYRGPRAIVRGTTVYIRHKGHAVRRTDHVTRLGAATAAARINRRNGWPDELPVLTPTGAFKRRNCPYCGKSVAPNWLKRHLGHYHLDEYQNGIS